MTTASGITDPNIAEAFERFPEKARSALLTVRGWIFDAAGGDGEIGEIVEELKWGQPSYATRPKTGCPIRLGMPKDGKSCALYVPCQTRLLTELRAHYDQAMPRNMSLEGNRGIHFDPGTPLPEAELKHAITLALTYYSAKG